MSKYIPDMKKIAIFASGSGTNAQNIMEYFKNNPDIGVEIVLSNKPEAKVLERAEKLDVPTVVFTKKQLYESSFVIDLLRGKKIDLIVLAGFLWLIPANLIQAFPEKMINIHPALLPKYGGKGMYGKKVLETVIENKEKETGISIHFVNEKYDEGRIIFQTKCRIDETDSVEEIATKVHLLEYQYFPEVIEKLLMEGSV